MLSSMEEFPISQNIFFKIFRVKNKKIYSLISSEEVTPGAWNIAPPNKVLETSLQGATYYAGYHSFLLKDDVYLWIDGLYTRKHTQVQLWEVEIDDLLMKGFTHEKYQTVVSAKMFPKKSLGYIETVNSLLV